MSRLDELENASKEPRPKTNRRPLAKLEARSLANSDPRVEWRMKARAFLNAHPEATCGAISDHLGIGIVEAVKALHDLKAEK